ncbi:calcium-activated potassium channel subunit alpha-1-like [Spea bombifrons]|uniref:calcium-activated potassium channel subunit alpha-1-like n=1 Tax=Spea bombifrons TaxID=233779 RepID=UPI00234A1ED6|nr:calcium-activated potassium channel subunit alpha-1-like [Spea bombifrons]
MPISSGYGITPNELILNLKSNGVFETYVILNTTYFNWQVLGLLQTLVTGGTTPELEEQLAEENALTNRSGYTGHTAPQDRCKLALVPLMDPKLDYHNGNTYGELFCNALTDSRIICFGIYRLMDDPDQQQRRYVITRPPKNFALLTTDQLYCVVPFRDQPNTPGLARSVSSTSIESLFADAST